jgi:hypothetical protein
VALSGVVDDEESPSLPDEMARRQGIDDGGKLRRRDKSRQPPTLSVRAAVDLRAEFQREAGLAGAGTADQGMDGDIDVVIDPRLKLGKEILATDQRELAGLRNEQVELARRVSRRGTTASVRRPELPAPQRQHDAGIAKGQGDGAAAAGDNDALAYVAGLNGPTRHRGPPPWLFVVSIADAPEICHNRILY